jgi:hypothetical protein
MSIARVWKPSARSSSSRVLRKDGHRKPLAASSRRLGRRYLVFDVDATRQAARQRALPCDPTLPAARRRLDAVCAPGYTGRKRGEVVRVRTTARRDAHAKVGSAPMAVGEMATLVVNWPRRCGPSRPP